MSYSLLEVCRSLGGICCLHPQGGSVGCVSISVPPSRLSLNLRWSVRRASQQVFISQCARYVNQSHADLMLPHGVQLIQCRVRLAAAAVPTSLIITADEGHFFRQE